MWRIYYDDGTTFGSDDGAWADAPSDGVQYVLDKPHGQDRAVVHSGADWYFELDGSIIATGDPGPLIRKFGGKAGRWCGHNKFEAIGRRVAAEANALQRGDEP